jgi:hypothetical protein
VTNPPWGLRIAGGRERREEVEQQQSGGWGEGGVGGWGGEEIIDEMPGTSSVPRKALPRATQYSLCFDGAHTKLIIVSLSLPLSRTVPSVNSHELTGGEGEGSRGDPSAGELEATWKALGSFLRRECEETPVCILSGNPEVRVCVCVCVCVFVMCVCVCVCVLLPWRERERVHACSG